ncbi:hypothetical protein MIZ03_3315 [Rhodoferax lithotrophicus]|uniref:Tetratricopeptide repeat protein 38 n=1 Tax=Rhodoferax lithotrophicus TaxID=2798804 RepID=A0ABM7MQ50_9BURK|nr:tetratricopeptide repeat protein [Rhodoferax sp. MIZ03]BCO28415.1 hypothetical protein MIZ03_3315 [Rhodoferax sp. MIZ03]
MSHDLQGLPVTGSAASVTALNAAIHDYYAWKGDPVGVLQQAAQDDPSFNLGNTAVASLLLLNGARGDALPVSSAIAAAQAQIGHGTRREQLHLDAAKAWAAGESIRAAELWEDILLDHPTDALALRFAHDTYFYLGHSNSIRDSVARVLPAWDTANANYGFVLGQYAFGLEEAGNLAQAEEVGRRALEINPEDTWAVHAVAHVLEMSSRQEEGIVFLNDTSPHWKNGRWLAVHNWWHLAVYLIEVGRAAEVLPRYDEFVRPKIKDDFILDLVDAAALLWRLELAGLYVGDRWQEIAAQWLTHADDHVLVFNDLHIALASTGARDATGQQALLKSLNHYITEGSGDNREISQDVGRQIVAAIVAFGQKNFQRVIDLLWPIRYKWIRIGGSHAQRDLLSQTLIAAALGAGNNKLAKALLAERSAWRPTQRSKQLFSKVLSSRSAN